MAKYFKDFIHLRGTAAKQIYEQPQEYCDSIPKHNPSVPIERHLGTWIVTCLHLAETPEVNTAEFFYGTGYPSGWAIGPAQAKSGVIRFKLM